MTAGADLREEKENREEKVLTAPTILIPFDTDDDRKLRVVIETPKGSRNKFALDPKEGVFELKKVLPAGMASI